MSENSDNPTRRKVLKTSLGSAGAMLLTGVAAADSVDEKTHIDTELLEAEEQQRVVILLSGALTDDVNIDVEKVSRDKLSQRVRDQQQTAVSTLSNIDGVEVHNSFWATNSLFATIDPTTADVEADLASLQTVDGIYTVRNITLPEPVKERPAEAIQQSDQDVATTYGLEQINAPAAQSTFDTQGEDVSIGVVDSGIDPSHPAHIDFDPDNFAEFTLEGDRVDTTPTDPDGHGTHVSGTVAGDQAADSEGTIRRIGVAPNAELYSALTLKPFDGGAASGTTVQVVAGIDYVVEQGADIVNMSLGGSVGDDFYLEVMRRIINIGVLPVAASGNTGAGESSSPGDIREVFSVGATDSSEQVVDFSNGERVISDQRWENDAPDDYPTFYTIPDVSAPGDEVLSSVPGGGYAELSGTSMASPHVAGVAALVLSEYPDLSPTEVATLLSETAVHPDGPDGEGIRYGTGIVDALAALTAAGDGNFVTGTVTDANDNPVSGVQVVSSYGTRAFTDDEGRYEIVLPAEESTLVFDKLGRARAQATSGSGSPLLTYAGEDRMFDADEVLDVITDYNAGDPDIESEDVLTAISLYNSDEPVDVGPDVTLDRTVEIQPLPNQFTPDGRLQRPEIVAGERFEIPLFVASLDELTVELTESSSGIDPSDVTLAVGETSFSLGETLPIGGYTGQLSLTVQVASDAVEQGTAEFGLVHTFAGGGETQSVQTPQQGTTTVATGTPPTFEITDSTLPTSADDDISVEAAIENTGDVQGTKPVTYEVGGFPFPESTTIAADETANFSISLSGLSGVFGGQTIPHRITTPDDEVSGEVKVEAASGGSLPRFDIVAGTAPSAVDGTAFEITVTVENAGTTGASLIELLFDPDQPDGGIAPKLLAFRAPDIEAGATEQQQFTVQTDGLPAGTYGFEVVTSADSQRFDVQIS